MRSPVLLGAGAGVLVVLLALLTALTLLAGTSLRLGDHAAGSEGGSGPAGAIATAAAERPSSSAEVSSPSAAGGAAPATSPTGTTASAAPGSTAPEASPALSSFGGFGTPTPSSSPRRVGTAVGDMAPPLVVGRLDGGTIDLAALRGRPVWVNFMATWCPPCRSELPLMDGYQAELGDRLTIVLVDVRESRGTVAGFANSLGLTLPIGLDATGRAQDDWGAFALPIHYWIDASGVVRAVAFGSLGPAQFQANLQTVLPGVQLRS